MSDAARSVRAGEELDLEKLTPWLHEHVGPGDVEVLQFPGGHSNLTYLVKLGGVEYVLRRPPFGSKVKSAHDMGREARILSRLAPVWPKVPRPVAFCEDEGVIGARFYVMERMRGTILRRDPPRGLLDDAATVRRLCESFVDTLVELHGIDWRAAGLGDLGHPDGYVERQVTGWSKRYDDAKTDEVPAMHEAAAWLASRIPVSPAPTIVHNDYKYDNLILAENDPTKIVGLLDWEMATIGDPLMDLGTTLCYWVEAGDPPDLQALRMGPTQAPGSLTRRALAERYAAATGRPLEHIVFYYVFGLFKTAVVLQQIYYRYKKGLTRDERFGFLGLGVAALAGQARRAMDRSGL